MEMEKFADRLEFAVDLAVTRALMDDIFTPIAELDESDLALIASEVQGEMAGWSAGSDLSVSAVAKMEENTIEFTVKSPDTPDTIVCRYALSPVEFGDIVTEQ